MNYLDEFIKIAKTGMNVNKAIREKIIGDAKDVIYKNIANYDVLFNMNIFINYNNVMVNFKFENGKIVETYSDKVLYSDKKYKPNKNDYVMAAYTKIKSSKISDIKFDEWSLSFFKNCIVQCIFNNKDSEGFIYDYKIINKQQVINQPIPIPLTDSPNGIIPNKNLDEIMKLREKALECLWHTIMMFILQAQKENFIGLQIDFGNKFIIEFKDYKFKEYDAKLIELIYNIAGGMLDSIINDINKKIDGDFVFIGIDKKNNHHEMISLKYEDLKEIAEDFISEN